MRNGPDRDDLRFGAIRERALDAQGRALYDFACALGVDPMALLVSIRGGTPLESPSTPSEALRFMKVLRPADLAFEAGIDALGLARKAGRCRCPVCKMNALSAIAGTLTAGDLP